MKTLEESMPPGTSPDTAPQVGGKVVMIPGDQLVARISEYSDEDRELVLWFYHFVRDRDLDYGTAALLLKKADGENYSRDSVYQLLTGRRSPDQLPRPLIKAIAEYRDIVNAEAAARRAPFIETSLAQRIFAYCEAAHTHHRIGWIYGDSQIGKTEALEEYQRRNNHGRTIMVRVPTRGLLCDFLGRLAFQCGISPRLPSSHMRRRIGEYFRANNLLIVDELHACFTPTERLSSYDVIEFVRELFDETKCGVILCATNVLRDSLDKTGVHRKVAVQCRRRGLAPLNLENVPLKSDLAKFAHHYGLTPATGEALALQTEIVTQEGLGSWLTFLAAGHRMAKKKAKPLAWSHVISAHAAFTRLSIPPREEEAR